MVVKEETRKKRKSYHSVKKRLQLGDVVYAKIGPKVNALTPSGKKSEAKQKLYGQIIQSVNNNIYVVSFSDGQKREMNSRSLKKANSQESTNFHQVFDELISSESDNNEIKSTASEHNEDVEDPFKLTTLMDVNQDLNFSHEINDSCDNDSDDMTFRVLDNLPMTSTNFTTNINKASKTLTSNNLSAAVKKKSNTAGVIENKYDKQMREAEEKIDNLCNEGASYTVKSGKGESVTWTLIPEHVDLQPLPQRREESLGISNDEIKRKIANSALPTADLFLQLVYSNGAWRRALESMNRKLQIHNESQARSASGINRRSISDFTEKEFLIGHAIIIGASDCSEKGENLWESSRSNKQWKKHWMSISSPTNFGRYMRFYRFKQFKQFLPLIWQDTSRPVETVNGNTWWKFDHAVSSFNEIRRNFIIPSEIIAIDESMSAFRPQTTKTGGLPNISYIFRKPEDLGSEFKCTGTYIQM